jgi:hypothetical protein
VPDKGLFGCFVLVKQCTDGEDDASNGVSQHSSLD